MYVQCNVYMHSTYYRFLFITVFVLEDFSAENLLGDNAESLVILQSCIIKD